MAKQRRVHKIAEQIRNCIALQLQRVADPRFSLVTITSAVVSPDLRNAKVYWMVSGDAERRDDVSEAFANAAGLFRRAIAQLFGRIHAENEARGGDGEEDQVSDEEPR
jgi:ribosome-binding factor A